MKEKKFFTADEIPAIPVDGRDRGFFILDDELLEDETLTIYDRAVYMVIVKHATRNGTRAGQCKLKNETIAREAGCSSRQVRVSLARLREKRQPHSDSTWIGVFPTKGAGGQTSNVYLVLPVGKKPKPQSIAPKYPTSTTDAGGRHTMPGGAAHDAGRAAYHADITRGFSNQTFSEQEVEAPKTAVANTPAQGRQPTLDASFTQKTKKTESEDPETQACCRTVYDDFAQANPGVRLNWHKAIRGPVKKLRSEVPSLTAVELENLLKHRRATPGVRQAELPKLYLTSITNYKNGPLNQFNREATPGENNATTYRRPGPAEKDATIESNVSGALQSRAARRMAGPEDCHAAVAI